MKAMTPSIMAPMTMILSGSQVPDFRAGHDPGEDDERDPVADAALRHLLAEPHDEDRPRGQGQHDQELEGQAGRGHDARPAGAAEALQEEGDAPGLDEADDDRAVAGVLGDLLPPELAFLAQPLEVRPDDLEELEDDRGADVGHDAQGEDRHPGHVPAREHVDEAQDRSRLGLPEFLEGVGRDAGVGDLAAGPVDGQQGEGEDDPLPQLGDAEDVADAVEHDQRPMRTALPPAFSILAWAASENLWA
jgi:hypothetical protein